MASRKLRIVHIADRFHPLLGGVERHVLEVGRQQVAAGHEVSVVTGQCEPDLAPTGEVEGIRILRYPALRSTLRQRLWFFRERRLLQSADIVHVHNVMVARHLAWMPAVRRKAILTIHGWGGRFPVPNAEVEQAQRTAARFPRLVCVGHFIEKWKSVAPDLVIYGGVTLPDMAPAPDRRAICLLGRLAADTGVREFCTALQGFRVPDAGSPGTESVRGRSIGGMVEVTVAGDGPLRGEVEALGESATLEVNMLGFTRDVFPVLAASRVVLTSGYLGILEALGMGARVISIADNPLKYDYLALSPMAEFIDIARNADDVRAMLTAAMRDDPEQDARVERGRAFARASSWQRVSKEYAMLYPALVGS